MRPYGRTPIHGGLTGEEALKNGMEEKAREFTAKGGELYAKA